MDALAQVKCALDAGLITAVDYEQAKAAFLRAQQVVHCPAGLRGVSLTRGRGRLLPQSVAPLNTPAYSNLRNS
eukprot:2213361-Pyramimonas_sp.AAC.1